MNECLQMDEYFSPEPAHPKPTGSSPDAIALFGYNSTACHLARLFASVGLQVYLYPSEPCSSSFSPHVTLVKDRTDLPYLSSILINCQHEYLPIKTLIQSFPKDYRQRMAYVECSLFLRPNQLESIYEEMKFSYYLCMNPIELDSSTTIQPHLHLVCSGSQVVYQKLLLQNNLAAKTTFLEKTKTPFDAFHLCLLHRYSQAIHLVVYAEMMGILKAANDIYPGNLQFLFDWSYIKRPLMRQMILQSPSSSFTFTTISDFQLLLECVIDYFEKKSAPNHIQAITCKLYQFISSLDTNQKQIPLFQLFTLY